MGQKACLSLAPVRPYNLMHLRLTLCLLTVVLLCAPAHGAEPPAPVASRYTVAMFRKAVAHSTTAPYYVLLSIRDGRDGSTRMVCTDAPFLLGALHREHALGWDEAGRREALTLALASEDFTFTLSKPDALANVSAHYSPEVLAEVRQRLRTRTDAQLRRAKTLEPIYVEKTGPAWRAYRDATAHVLLERGILCGHGDWAPVLWVEPAS